MSERKKIQQRDTRTRTQTNNEDQAVIQKENEEFEKALAESLEVQKEDEQLEKVLAESRELYQKQHQDTHTRTKTDKDIAIQGSLKGNKSSNLMLAHYKTIRNNGSCREEAYYEDENNDIKTCMNQCILISIMDHLKLLRRLDLDCSINKFIELHSKELNNWDRTHDFQVGDQIKTDLLRRLCEKEGLDLRFVRPAINNDELVWKNDGMFGNMTYKKNTTVVYILCLPNHYELLVNGFNENRYDKEMVKQFTTREIYIEEAKKFIDYYKQNMIMRNENMKRLSSIDRLRALIVDQQNNITQMKQNNNYKDTVKDMEKELIEMMNCLTDETKATSYLKKNKNIMNKYLKYKQKYLQLKNLLKKQKIL